MEELFKYIERINCRNDIKHYDKLQRILKITRKMNEPFSMSSFVPTTFEKDKVIFDLFSTAADHSAKSHREGYDIKFTPTFDGVNYEVKYLGRRHQEGFIEPSDKLIDVITTLDYNFKLKNDMKITVCECDGITPLIWTSKWVNTRLWCPSCGFKTSHNDFGIEVDQTDEIVELVAYYEAVTDPYLSGEESNWSYVNQRVEK